MLSSPRLTIAGLGPGRADLVPPATISRAKEASRVLVRTRNHPAVAVLVSQGIRFETFDSLYDQAPDSESLCALIADGVLEAAKSQDVIYIVPGNPLLAERTVEIILGTEAGRRAEIIPATKPDDAAAWVRFLSVLEELRGDHGCPWDKEQTYESLTRFVLEEASEVVSAALERDADKLKEELGDLLLEIGLYAQIARERGDFQPKDILSSITGKLVRRHPHVFGDETLLTPGEVSERWAQIKREEPGRYEEGHSLMDEVPGGLPALLRAQRQQSLAGNVGFDWESADPVFQKVREELGELDRALQTGDSRQVKDEVGDLLFATVNLARKVGVDAETALLGSVAKFSRRFRRIEHYLAEQGLTMKGHSLEFLDTLWERAKDEEGKEEGFF